MVLVEGGVWGELTTVDELIKDWARADSSELGTA
jgi:hypothetical protein